ncbi:MAG: histidine--tRNA ligase [Endomicrobium sp.]|jgi:histidyl-tRNA synthetase|nr:histidine--tRNA ligase [Endomicrobium sp.]
MNYKAPRGTHDIFGINALKLNLLEQKIREIFIKHGFEEIKTPIFEEASLFASSIGQSTDIVKKEMYIFNDKKNRKLALRPEGTASLVRSFIENKMDTFTSVWKFFYIGEMFRYERPQAGRFRQFRQAGVEFYGNAYPSADVEIIVLAQDLLSAIGINETNIHINSLGCKKCGQLFKKVLIEYFTNRNKELCDNCINRLKENPLRILDCKLDSYKFTDIPKISDYLCYNCRENFNLVQSMLKIVKCNYIVNNKLVRGIDYYTGVVFEIRSNIPNSQYAFVAGGRYDNLIKKIGGKDIPAVGFAAGVERLLSIVNDKKLFDNFKNPEKIFVAVTDQKLFNCAFAFTMKISKYGIKNNKNISVFGPIYNESLTNQLKFASKIQVFRTIIFAADEFKKGKVLIKKMSDKTQEAVSINDL